MTASFTRTLRLAGLVLAVAAFISALSSTSSFAFSAEAQQMCTSDAFRLCGSEIPNIPKITACMMAKPSCPGTWPSEGRRRFRSLLPGHDDLCFRPGTTVPSDADLRAYRALTSTAPQNLIALLVPPI